MNWLRSLLIIALSVLPFTGQASVLEDYIGTDRIANFEVDMIVRPDGIFDVQETITYDFSYPGHGIVRVIPYVYKQFGFNNNIDIELSSITDGNGKPLSYKSISPGNVDAPVGNLVWQVGDANHEVEGKQTYRFNYTVNWAMLYHDDFNEVYWNVTGDQWNVPIDHASVVVHLPNEKSLSPLYQATCYTGFYGDTSQNCTVNEAGDTVTAVADGLLAQQGLSIDVALTPEAIHKPSNLAVALHLAANNWTLFLIPFLIAIFFIVLMTTRQTRSRKPLIPIYEAPKQINRPSLAETLLNGATTSSGLTGELIELARTGYVQFIYDEKKQAVATLKRTDKPAPDSEPARTILATIFAGNAAEVTLSKLRTAYTLVSSTNALAQDDIKAAGWINKPLQLRLYLAMIGALGAFVGGGFIIIYGNNHSANHAIASGIACIILAVAIWIRRGVNYLALNQAGADAKQLLAGFKWFLKVTEEERLKFTQAPKLTPQLFESFLPYAIALGVERQWAKQFEQILTEPPSWLVGVPHGYYGISHAVFAVGDVRTQFRAPTNSSSGGFGGGGFSGGGFGGGGGGRW